MRDLRRRPGEVIGALRRSMEGFAEKHAIKRVGVGGKVDWAWRFTPSDTAYLGLIITAVVAVMTYVGTLDPAEQLTYDMRMRYAQWGRPAPTDQLAHLDLDDRSINDIGRWPWSRAVQAELLKEVGMAKPKAVGLDILYSEPENDTILEAEPGKTYVKVMNDRLFQEAIAGLGNVIVPFAHEDSGGVMKSSTFEQMVSRLREKPTLTEEELVAALPREEGRVRDAFYLAREEAIEKSVRQRMAQGESSNQIIMAMMGDAGANEAVAANSPVRRLIEQAWQRENARLALLPHRAVGVKEVTAKLDDRDPDLLPVEGIAKSAAMTAFVTYNKEGDGTMRRVPLVMNLGGAPVVSLGLGLACEMLEAPLKSVRVEEDRVVIEGKLGKREVPIRTVHFDRLARETGGVFDLPWFGQRGDGWLTMYDRPGDPHTVSMSEVYQAVVTRQRIAANNERLRTACLVMDRNDPEMEKRTYDAGDPTAWIKTAREKLEANSEIIEELDKLKPKDSPNEQERYVFVFHRATVSARELIGVQEELGKQLTKVRESLAKKLGGRAVLVGWTATGRTDFVATPLHPACAGVRIHGVVLNAILTEQYVRFSPMWVTLVITAVMGLLGTWAVMGLNPLTASMMSAAMALAYSVTAVVLFGPRWYALGLAGPLFAIGGTWLFCSGLRYLIEVKEKKAIRDRFQSYVDPQLVNYLQAHPEKLSLEGERRLMTVCFTDLQGFTTLSEKLGEETVGLLNEYFSVMVPLIRKHRGYVNKFLGDGIMFFFNAPYPHERHAGAAFEAVLEMQAALRVFNEQLASRGLPTVKMRVGITTGQMIAGDAGGGGAVDYTVLGDVVNLSSRLEGANKASGTLILCNKEACEHAGGEFLTRPIGTLKVVGKTQGIETFEVMGKIGGVSPAMRKMAELTERMVDAYRNGQMSECAMWAEQLRDTGDGSKLAGMYLGLSRVAPGGSFDGSIVLESK